MTVKDFKVGDEVVYLDFNGKSNIEQATIKTGYVKYVGRKVVRVGKFKNNEYGYDFIISDSGLCLEVNCNCSCSSRYDLVFRNKEDYKMYTKYRGLKHWAYRFNFDRLPYDKLTKIKEIVENDS
jgi:hypothetical protein